ncbi:MAG: NAD(P)-dependent oxidoreductase [Candidatus Latescibacterota bacterium]|nr:NAD(P)-dependent oxidoreductase [Candidatus Latescibacterota bacterium]
MYVLVTGAAGKVGSCVFRGLTERHRVRVMDRVAIAGVGDQVTGDLGDFATVCRAVRGVDAVIHIGGNPGEKPWPEIRNNNYVGCCHVFEAARELGVQRVAFASRAGLLSAYPAGVQRTVDMLPRPRSLYDNSKVFGESLCSMYAARFDMQTVSVRIGNFNPERDQPEHPHHLSHGDCVRAFEQAITHPVKGFQIVFGVSDSNWPLYDLDHGKKAIGYAPKDFAIVPERGRDRPETPEQELPRPAHQLGRVLITGASGRVGSVLARELGSSYGIRGLDRVANLEIEDMVVGDVTDSEVCRQSVRDVDAIIHLAGVADGSSSWHEVLENNFDGMVQIMDAAIEAGVPRFAFASRAGILGPYPRNLQRTVEMYPRPESYYTISKIFGEGLGHMYHTRHGLEFVSVRIGNFKLERDLPEHPHQLSHTDCVRVFEAAITSPGVNYEVVFGVSDSDWPLYDLEHGRRAIGYEPANRSVVPKAKRQ